MPPDQVFEGLRVVEFTCYGAGPIAGRWLADHGAECIKVESFMHMDDIRRIGPFAGGIPGTNRSAYWTEYNQGRLAVTLNLGSLEGVALAKKLVSIADVVIENFAGGVAERWGLTYGDLCEVRPDVIYLRMNMLGHTGDGQFHRGAGNTLQALSGFCHITGWPDRPPLGTGVPYTDFIVPQFAAAALIAALIHRDRTGEGQYIDLSQLEAALHFIAPTLMDFDANGIDLGRSGNRDRDAVPHGVFPCRGDDRWVAIAIEDDVQWEALRRVLAMDEVHLPEGPDPATRRACEDEIEACLARWTSEQDAPRVMSRLQAEGVPAASVHHGGDLFDDPQLSYREHYVPLNHPEIGIQHYEMPSFRLSETPALLRRAPLLGEHNEYVFETLLKLSREELDALRVKEVIA